MTDPAQTYVKQHGGRHYETTVPGKQHWDLVEKYDISYLEACATKYVLRWRNKAGVDDLRKSLTYVEKAIKCRPAQGARRLVPLSELMELHEAMGTEERERGIVNRILASGSHDDFLWARMELQKLIAENE